MPILPPSFLRMTTVAARGRPSGSKSGQLLTARGLAGVGAPQKSVGLARVLHVDEERALVGRGDDAGDLDSRAVRRGTGGSRRSPC